MFALIPGFILQRLLLGDVTPDSFCAGLAALLPRPAPESPEGSAGGSAQGS